MALLLNPAEGLDFMLCASGVSDFKFWVMAWLFALQDDPTTHAARVPELGDQWWFAKIPNAEDEHQAVVCLYSIEDDVVRCSGFTTLNKPVI